MHNLVVGHKLTIASITHALTGAKDGPKELKFSQKQRSLTFLFATNNAIVGRTVSQHPVSTTVRKSRDYPQCF